MILKMSQPGALSRRFKIPTEIPVSVKRCAGVNSVPETARAVT
jgi:hypothetical protein